MSVSTIFLDTSKISLRGFHLRNEEVGKNNSYLLQVKKVKVRNDDDDSCSSLLCAARHQPRDNNRGTAFRTKMSMT